MTKKKVFVSIDGKRYSRSDIFSKSALARKMNCSPAWINKKIQKGELIEIEFAGVNLVAIPK
jgi:hypothetical protein